MRRFSSLALVVMSAANAVAAEPPRLTIPRLDRPPALIDFEATDGGGASHAGMARVEGFVQRLPNDGQPVSERTVAFAGYDDAHLYVVFVCFDRNVQAIGAHLVSRDLLPNDDDTVAVYIDTFRDLKHAYGFQQNAAGVQTDGAYTEGSNWDLSWDAVWHSEARRTPWGYVAMFRIPFRSLRFPATDAQQWGIFFFRSIARRNEVAYWPECSTRYAARFPQAAVVEDLHHVSPGRNLQAIPYAAARSLKRPDFTRDQETTIGLDGKAVVRDSIVFDGTINPDFSQVESDAPQITVNKPFEVFFPEKRPFFLENATYFNTPLQLLFTRRIANPLIGGRATGRIGAYSVGALVVDDRSPFDGQADRTRAWYGVARAIRDLGRESYIGVFTSQRSMNGQRNQNGAVDGRWKFAPNWFAAGQAAVSENGSALYGAVVGAGRRFNYEFDFNDRSRDFRAMNGFVPRVDTRSVDQSYAFRARPSKGSLQAFGPNLVVSRTWDHRGAPLDWSATPRFSFQWPRLTTFNVYYTAGRQTLRPIEVPAIDQFVLTDVSRYGGDFSTSWSSRLVWSATFFFGNAANLTPAGARQPRAGRIADATATASVRVSRGLTTDWSYLFDRLVDAELAQEVYTNSIVRLRVGDQFTRALSVRAIVEWNRLAVDRRHTALPPSQNVNYDLLFTYLSAPGTALYVGGNYNVAATDPFRLASLTNNGWQVFTKVSYLIRR